MSFTFRPAIRENVPLILGLAAGTGGGKTRSAFEVAYGLSGGKKFRVIDTESGRALTYAPPAGKAADPTNPDPQLRTFDFDHGLMSAPFSPSAYAGAIADADDGTVSVIVVDSMSHEWAGEGGCMEMHDDIVAAAVERKRKMAQEKGWAFDEWKEQQAQNIQAWILPKTSHRRMVQRLLQVRSHLILCFRAEDKIEVGKDAQGKTAIQPKVSPTGFKGWTPQCEKNLPYELTLSVVMTAANPGVPEPIKIPGQLRQFVPLDRPLDAEVGRKLALWASGAPPVDWAKALNAAASLPDLVAVWGKIPAGQRKGFTAVKDARKAALETPAHDAEGVAIEKAHAAAEPADYETMRKQAEAAKEKK